MRLRPTTFMATLESYQKSNPEPVTILTTESIAFQKNDMFGPQLEAVFAKYQDLIEAGASKTAIGNNKVFIKEIESIVKARLGISIKLITNKNTAATIPNVFIPHNGIIREEIRYIYETYNKVSGQAALRTKSHGDILGTVNTQTVKVTGWFSEQVVPVYINVWKLMSVLKFTPAEVVSVILHELGHDFNAILFSSRINTSNRVLSDIIAHISDKDRGGSVDYIYINGKIINPDMTKDIAEGLLSGDQLVMSISLYRLMIGSTKTLMDSAVYDRTGFEAVSDIFATRFGYGLESITSMEKMEKLDPEYEMDRELNNGILAFVSMQLAFSLIFAFSAVMATSFVIKTILGLCIYLDMTMAISLLNYLTPSGKDMTYDNIRDRYSRIRLQMVEIIKDPDVPDNVKRVLLDQISSVDIIISEKKVFVGVIERISRFIRPSDRRIVANIELQRSIENMIANDIFVSVNKLALKN